jgi:hypothetical protein
MVRAGAMEAARAGVVAHRRAELGLGTIAGAEPIMLGGLPIPPPAGSEARPAGTTVSCPFRCHRSEIHRAFQPRLRCRPRLTATRPAPGRIRLAVLPTLSVLPDL